MSLIFILLGTFFLLAFLGVPIAISLGVASGIGMLTAGVSVSGIAQRMFAGVDSFSYLAIPMFMLAGKLMEYGGISARIVQVAKILCAKVRGGLAITPLLPAPSSQLCPALHRQRFPPSAASCIRRCSRTAMTRSLPAA